MRIRRCAEADVASTGAFYDRVVRWLDGHVNYPKWIHGFYPSEASVREAARAGDQCICLEGREIVGAFVLNADSKGNDQAGRWKRPLPDGAYGVLHTLAVAPDRQGRGIASEIIRYCSAKARSEGYRALRVDIVPTNHPARKLYEKNGFTYAGDVDLAAA